MTRFEHIAVHSANRVKTVTLNRPEKRNGLILLLSLLQIALEQP